MRNASDSRFAISTAQLPTESRPGHIAMFSGFYEDISTISRGWTDNPIDFDSVFNQSTYTWSWGCADVLNMFKQPGKIFETSYQASFNDFAAAETSILDTWTLEHFEVLESF